MAATPSPIAVVTGATGHLGVNVAQELLAAGRTVRCLVRSRTAPLDGLPVSLVPGDITQPDTVADAFEGASEVYHCAAAIGLGDVSPQTLTAINVGGTDHVIAAARAVGARLVHVSSAYALAQTPYDLPLDESRAYVAPRRRAHYALTKAEAERHVLAAASDGLHAVVVSPTGILGPVDRGPSRIGAMLMAVAAGKIPAVPSGGFDWVDVRDVAAATVAAATRGRPGGRYLLGGVWQPLQEVARLAAELHGRRAPRTIPRGLLRLGVPLARGWARVARRPPSLTHESLDALCGHRDIRHDLATADLGLQPRPLADTVRDFFEAL